MKKRTLPILMALPILAGCGGSQIEGAPETAAPQPASAKPAAPAAKPKNQPKPRASAAPTAVAAKGEQWAQFRGPGGQGISRAKGLPVKWSATENIIWKKTLPGPGSSSPIVWGNSIFLTCYTGYGESVDRPGDMKNLKRHLLCLDSATGNARWTRTVAATRSVMKYERFLQHHGYASHTPATDGKRVYVYFAKSGALAYDMNGAELWRFADVGNGHGNGFGSGGGITLYDNLVIVNSSPESNAFIALDKKTGRQVWRHTGVVQAFNHAALLGNELIIDSRDKMFGLNPRTGAVLWTGKGPPAYVCNSPTVADGIAYITHGYRGPTVAIGPGNEEIWSTRIQTTVPSPLVVDGLVYIVSNDMLNCLDAKTGAEVFRERMGVKVTQDIYASPFAADGRIYIVTRKDGTLVFEQSRQMKLLAQNRIAGDDSLWNASPAVTGSRLLLRSDKAIYCIGK